MCDKAWLDFEVSGVETSKGAGPKSLMPKEKTLPVLCSHGHCGADICSEFANKHK